MFWFVPLASPPEWAFWRSLICANATCAAQLHAMSGNSCSFKREESAPLFGTREIFGESGLLENEPTAPAEQAHTTQRQ